MRVPAFAPARNREVVREAREVYDLREANERRRVPCDVVAAVLVYARGVTSGAPRAGARGEHQTRDQQQDGPCAGILHGSPAGVIHAPRSATRSVVGRRSAMGGRGNRWSSQGSATQLRFGRAQCLQEAFNKFVPSHKTPFHMNVDSSM